MAGLPVLCSVLSTEQGDKEMLRGALECLNIAVAPSQVQIFTAGQHADEEHSILFRILIADDMSFVSSP